MLRVRSVGVLHKEEDGTCHCGDIRCIWAKMYLWQYKFLALQSCTKSQWTTILPLLQHSERWWTFTTFGRTFFKEKLEQFTDDLRVRLMIFTLIVCCALRIFFCIADACDELGSYL